MAEKIEEKIVLTLDATGANQGNSLSKTMQELRAVEAQVQAINAALNGIANGPMGAVRSVKVLKNEVIQLQRKMGSAIAGPGPKVAPRSAEGEAQLQALKAQLDKESQILTEHRQRQRAAIAGGPPATGKRDWQRQLDQEEAAIRAQQASVAALRKKFNVLDRMRPTTVAALPAAKELGINQGEFERFLATRGDALKGYYKRSQEFRSPRQFAVAASQYEHWAQRQRQQIVLGDLMRPRVSEVLGTRPQVQSPQSQVSGPATIIVKGPVPAEVAGGQVAASISGAVKLLVPAGQVESSVGGTVKLLVPSAQIEAGVSGVVKLVIPAGQIAAEHPAKVSGLKSKVSGPAAAPAVVAKVQEPITKTQTAAAPEMMRVTIPGAQVSGEVAGVVTVTIPSAQLEAGVAGAVKVTLPGAQIEARVTGVVKLAILAS